MYHIYLIYFEIYNDIFYRKYRIHKNVQTILDPRKILPIYLPLQQHQE